MNQYNPASPAIPQLKASEMAEVFGRSGTDVYSGYFEIDRVSDWNDPYTRSKIINQMRREFVAVQTGLAILKAPILSTGWSIEGGDEDIRQFLEEEFFGMTQRTYQELLIEVLSYLEFGFSIFEIIWTQREDGKIGLFDLAPRIQESIEKFTMEDGGAGVLQRLDGDITTGNGFANIPMNKLVIFTNNKEGDDLIGQSVLRAARSHTVYIDTIYRVQGMAIERQAMGIPVIKYPKDTSGDAEKRQAENLGQNLKANERAYIATTTDWEIEILTPKGNPLGGTMENAIAHHNRQILMTCMAHGLDTGSTGVGSLALSKTQQWDRLSFAEQKANYIASVLNKFVLQRLVDVNFGKQEEYPKLVFEALGVEDSVQLATQFKQLHDIGAIDMKDPEMVNYIRRIFSVPELTEEQIEDLLIKYETTPPQEDSQSREEQSA